MFVVGVESSKPAPGTRVVAIREVNDDGVAVIFGFGTYDGDFPCPLLLQVHEAQRDLARRAIVAQDGNPASDELAYRSRLVEEGWPEADVVHRICDLRSQLTTEQQRPIEDRIDDLIEKMSMNPRITLDNGRIIWGMECWWSIDVDGFRQRHSDITEVPIE